MRVPRSVRALMYGEALAVLGLAITAWALGTSAASAALDVLLSVVVIGALTLALGFLCGRAASPRVVVATNAVAVAAGYLLAITLVGPGEGGSALGYLVVFGASAVLDLVVGLAGYELGRETTRMSTT